MSRFAGSFFWRPLGEMFRAASFIIGGFFLATVTIQSIKKTKPMNDQPKPTETHSKRVIEPPQGVRVVAEHHGKGEGFQGVYQSEGFSVVWRGSSDFGATVEDAVDAVIDRLQYEQKTELASNEKAKALIALIDAQKALNGIEPTQTTDGIEVIE